MAENKIFYWLKLNEGWFDDDTIKYIESLDNGIAYSNLYLKLILKSIRNNGKLIRLVGTTLMPYDVESLAEITRIPSDTVRVAMELFKKIGVVEILETGEIYFSQINELIGNETDKARMMRRLRAERKIHGIIEESNNVTNVLPNRYTEKEKYKEIELDIDINNNEEEYEEEGNNSNFVNLFREFEEELKRPLSQKESEFLLMLTNSYSADLISLALKEAVLNNARSFKYVESILIRWKGAGITTVDEAIAQIDKFNKMKASKQRLSDEDVDRLLKLNVSPEEQKEGRANDLITLYDMYRSFPNSKDKLESYKKEYYELTGRDIEKDIGVINQ